MAFSTSPIRTWGPRVQKGKIQALNATLFSEVNRNDRITCVLWVLHQNSVVTWPEEQCSILPEALERRPAESRSRCSWSARWTCSRSHRAEDPLPLHYTLPACSFTQNRTLKTAQHIPVNNIQSTHMNRRPQNTQCNSKTASTKHRSRNGHGEAPFPQLIFCTNLITSLVWPYPLLRWFWMLS